MLLDKQFNYLMGYIVWSTKPSVNSPQYVNYKFHTFLTDRLSFSYSFNTYRYFMCLAIFTVESRAGKMRFLIEYFLA